MEAIGKSVNTMLAVSFIIGGGIPLIYGSINYSTSFLRSRPKNRNDHKDEVVSVYIDPILAGICIKSTFKF